MTKHYTFIWLKSSQTITNNLITSFAVQEKPQFGRTVKRVLLRTLFIHAYDLDPENPAGTLMTEN